MPSFPANPESERPAEKPSDNQTRPREAGRQLDDLRGKVDRHELADPSKLHEEGYGSGSKTRTEKSSDKGKASQNGEQTLDLSLDIYNSAQAKSILAKTGDVNLPAGLLDKTKGKPMPSFAELNSFNNKDYAEAFWGDGNFVKNLSSQADATLNKMRGDNAPLQTAQGKVDDSREKLIGSHQGGDRWQANGTEYYLDQNKDLIYKDKAGFHYRGADGLKFDGNGRESTLEKNGETVIKRGDQYLKKFANGEEVEIKNKEDIEAIVKLENLAIEQRKTAIQKLDHAGMTKAADHDSKIVTATDGLAVFRKDKDGNLVAKSSNEDGASIRLKDGQQFKVMNGKISKVDADGGHSPVSDHELPPEIKRGENGAIHVGSVTLTKDNKLTDTENDVLMHDREAKVTAKTEKGPVTTEVVDGISTVKTAEHSFVYDSTNGKYTVLNANNTVNLSYDDATRTMVTDGVTYTPSGTQIGNTFVNNDGGYAARKATVESEKKSESTPEKEAAKHAEQGAESELAEVAADINSYSATDADVAKLQGDLALLQSLKGGDELSAQVQSHISSEQAAILAALPNAQKQADAADTAGKLLGTSNPQLTQFMVNNGGGLATTDLQRYGVLPLELYDSSQAA